MVDLSAFDAAFDNAKPPESNFDAPPDGKYQVSIEKMELAEAGPEAKPVIRWGLRILAGSMANKLIEKSAFITPKTIDFIKKDLALLGFAGKFSDIEMAETRMTFIGKQLEVQVKRKGEYQGKENVNVYFNRMLNLGGGAPAPAAGERPPF